MATIIDPYEHYADLWINVSLVPVLIENLEHMHLFDALIMGSWGPMSYDNSIMYQIYPCGVVFVGDQTESCEFDLYFANKDYFITGYNRDWYC